MQAFSTAAKRLQQQAQQTPAQRPATARGKQCHHMMSILGTGFARVLGQAGQPEAAEHSRPDAIEWPSRRRECHFADIPFLSVLKHQLKGEGGAAE